MLLLWLKKSHVCLSYFLDSFQNILCSWGNGEGWCDGYFLFANSEAISSFTRTIIPRLSAIAKGDNMNTIIEVRGLGDIPIRIRNRSSRTGINIPDEVNGRQFISWIILILTMNLRAHSVIVYTEPIKVCSGEVSARVQGNQCVNGVLFCLWSWFDNLSGSSLTICGGIGVSLETSVEINVEAAVEEGNPVIRTSWKYVFLIGIFYIFLEYQSTDCSRLYDWRNPKMSPRSALRFCGKFRERRALKYPRSNILLTDNPGVHWCQTMTIHYRKSKKVVDISQMKLIH